MMHIFINSLAANAGGGLTYVRNVVPRLAERHDIQATILVSTLPEKLTSSPTVTVLEQPDIASTGRRFWREQWIIPKLIAQTRADILITTGNFAIWNSPVPQILLSRNALYTSAHFRHDLRTRGDYRLWLDTNFKAALARASIHRSECTVAPSAAFAAELRDWTGLPVSAIHHGWDAGRFLRNGRQLPQPVQAKLAEYKDALRLLYVSHYNYYRNFRTLIEALPRLKKHLAPKKLKLILTCAFDVAGNPSGYHPGTEFDLLHSVGVADDIVQLGTVPYDLLHNLYAACDIYVTTAYAESFAHPLVEAMASGLPIVASDLPVHREVCRDAAIYFSPFSSQQLASRMAELACSPEMCRAMAEKGRRRANFFSWRKHVEQLISLAECLVEQRRELRSGSIAAAGDYAGPESNAESL